MIKIGAQLKQTIISTGVVGACFGSVAVLGLLLVGPGSNARLAAQGIAPPHWTETAFFLACVFFVITIGSVALFGILPALLGKLFALLAKKLRSAA